jgi:hypothetical protein
VPTLGDTRFGVGVGIWTKDLDNHFGRLVDDREISPGRGVRDTSSTFPVLDGVEAESEGVRELSLGHVEMAANLLDIDLLGKMDPETLGLSGEVGLHIVEAAHEFIEYALHGSSPVVVGENLVSPLFQFVTLRLAEVGLHLLWKDRDQKDGELLVFVDVNDTRPAALAFTHSGKPKLPKTSRTLQHVTAVRIGSNRIDDFRNFIAAEELFSGCVEGGSFYDGLQLYFVLQWTPSVKRENVPPLDNQPRIIDLYVNKLLTSSKN